MKYNNYCGNENVAYIYFNEWSDPKIEYHGFQWSAWEIEDALHYDFLETGIPETDSAFAAYINTHVEEYLTELLYSLETFDIEFIKKNAPSWFNYLKIDYEIENDRNSWYVSDREVLEHYAGTSFVLEDFVSCSELAF